MRLASIRRIAANRRTSLLTAAVSIMAIAAVACGSNAVDPTATASGVGSQPVANNTGTGNIGVSTGEGSSGIPVSDSRGITNSSFAPTTYYNPSNGQVGIWVTGVGSKEVSSDVAKVFLGVQSKELTVSEARQNAAEAMTAVLDAIRAIGVSDDDIVTTSFNIYPETIWVEVNDSFGRHSEPRITGYTVSNNVEVTVRDLDLLDDVIDSAAEKGGDLIRVNSISFTVANPELHGEETRLLAAANARAKAELYAKAMGVNLGPLLYLTEIGSSAPLANQSFGEDAMLARAEFAPTPIQSGEVGLSTTIQAAFAIVP